ncbi:MAG: cysteine--tRNA ligase [Patescibacteria group bacterium]
MLKFYNTFSRKIEELRPLKGSQVGLYTCGPTVYDFAHIGNLRTYIFEDILHRVLEYNGYKVDHAMNITDVGHLVGDGDEGEDKLEVGAKREGKSPLEIARKYEEKFFSDLAELNIIKPNQVLRATESIEAQIEIIKILEEKGFAYKGKQAVYFDISKFPDYGKLSGQKLSEKMTGARKEIVIDKDKKHPQDFALWFFLTGRYQNHILHWPSPWGEGFPGWHIECSAISRKLLGQPFDIHTGGVDHIGTHHTNEIAQSEAAFGAPLANLWMHGEFLLIDSGRMGKSEGNLLTLDELKKRGFSPLDFRYMCLQAHYRTQLNFTWEALLAAHNALDRLSEFSPAEKPHQVGCAEYEQEFQSAINDDLNVPQALGIVWEMVDDSAMPVSARINSLLKFDKVLGLDLANTKPQEIILPVEASALINARQLARDKKDFAKSDEIRLQIEDLGYVVSDTPGGQKIRKKITF